MASPSSRGGSGAIVLPTSGRPDSPQAASGRSNASSPKEVRFSDTTEGINSNGYNGNTRGLTYLDLIANKRNTEMNIEDAIEELGVGRTQWVLLVIAGLTFTADAAEVTFLSYVTEVLKCEWHLTDTQESWITSSVFIGMIIGASIWGFVADSYGRRTAFLLSSIVITTFGFATALCQGFVSLLIVRAIVGFGVAGIPVGFDILAEALPGSSRGSFLLYIEYFWTIGSIYVNIAAWGVLEKAGWQVFTAMAAIPTLIASVAGYLFLPESPRWLVDENRDEEALLIINKWAAANKSETRFSKITKTALHTEHVSLMDLCKKRSLRFTTIAMSVVWFGFGVTYYGVVMLLPRILSTKSQAEAQPTAGVTTCKPAFDFKDLAIASAAEIVGVIIAILMIDRCGRVWTQGVFYSLGGVCLFLLGFRDLDVQILTAFASVGRLAEMAASCATWVHTPELYPTKVRAEAHTLLNLASKVGAFCAPFLINSTLFTQLQCAGIMVAVSLAATVAACTLPETAGQELSAVSEVADSDLDTLSTIPSSDEEYSSQG